MATGSQRANIMPHREVIGELVPAKACPADRILHGSSVVSFRGHMVEFDPPT
jgi:hypothetical protein